MAFRRHSPLSAGLLWLAGSACSATSRPVEPIQCDRTDIELSAPLRTFEVSGDESSLFSGADPTGATTTPAPSAATPACASGGSAGGTDAGGGGTGGSAGGVAGSATGTGIASFTLEPIEGGRCGSQQAAVLRSRGHNDWGSLFGDWQLASAPSACGTCGPWDGTGYDGMAIWARAGKGSDEFVTILIDTWQTSAAGTTEADADLVCKVDCNASSGTRSRDDAGNVTSQTYIPRPGTCGNSFQRTLTLSEQWQLVLLPFSTFYQDLKPNASPGGIDPKHINGLTFRTAKEANLELWIDEVAFYKHK